MVNKRQQYRKPPSRDITGVLLLDKPHGRSSNHVLQEVKRLYQANKAGHTGSLDPIATGLLPICFGQATKITRYFLDSDKRYETIIKLGVTTDTLDIEGQSLLQRDINFNEQQLQQALKQFMGDIKQIPPMYSALKKDGQPLYKLARKGREIEREARDMTVYELTAQRIDASHLKLNVHCSSGFYIRQLAYDLGEALGCGAHVTELRRTASKGIDISQAVTLEQIKQLDSLEKLDDYLQPVDELLSFMPELIISEQQAEKLAFGQQVNYSGEAIDGLLRVYNTDKRFVAIGEITENGVLKTHKVFI